MFKANSSGQGKDCFLSVCLIKYFQLPYFKWNFLSFNFASIFLNWRSWQHSFNPNRICSSESSCSPEKWLSFIHSFDLGHLIWLTNASIQVLHLYWHPSAGRTWVTWENQTLFPQINRCKLTNVVCTTHCGNNLKRMIMQGVMMGLSNRRQTAKSEIACHGSLESECLPKASDRIWRFCYSISDTQTWKYCFIYSLNEHGRCLNAQAVFVSYNCAELQESIWKSCWGFNFDTIFVWFEGLISVNFVYFSFILVTSPKCPFVAAVYRTCSWHTSSTLALNQEGSRMFVLGVLWDVYQKVGVKKSRTLISTPKY